MKIDTVVFDLSLNETTMCRGDAYRVRRPSHLSIRRLLRVLRDKHWAGVPYGLPSGACYVGFYPLDFVEYLYQPLEAA